MNPTIVYDLGHARLAEMHRQARRDALGRAANTRCRPDRPARPAPGPLAVLTRWTGRLGRVSAS
jgi:hypothetical protein